MKESNRKKRASRQSIGPAGAETIHSSCLNIDSNIILSRSSVITQQPRLPAPNSPPHPPPPPITPKLNAVIDHGRRRPTSSGCHHAESHRSSGGAAVAGVVVASRSKTKSHESMIQHRFAGENRNHDEVLKSSSNVTVKEV